MSKLLGNKKGNGDNKSPGSEKPLSAAQMKKQKLEARQALERQAAAEFLKNQNNGDLPAGEEVTEIKPTPEVIEAIAVESEEVTAVTAEEVNEVTATSSEEDAPEAITESEVVEPEATKDSVVSEIVAEEIPLTGADAGQAPQETPQADTGADADSDDEDAEAINEANFVPDRKTPIDVTNKTWLLKSFFQKQKELNFNIPIQRNVVWNDYQRSMLIHSILYGFYVPPIVARKVGKTMEMIDGKQRGTTITEFRSDKLRLHKDTPELFGYKLAGKKFSELSPALRDIFDSREITLAIHDELSDAEMEELFTRLQGGTPLTKFQVLRVKAAKAMIFIGELGNHNFFNEYITLSGKQRQNNIEQEIIMQTIMLFTKGPKTGLSSPDMEKFVKEQDYNHREVDTTLQQTLKAITSYLQDAIDFIDEKNRQTPLRRVHVPMLFMAAEHILKTYGKDAVRPRNFAEWIKTFYLKEYDRQSQYKGAASNSSAKPDKVEARINNVIDHMTKFFADPANITNAEVAAGQA